MFTLYARIWDSVYMEMNITNLFYLLCFLHWKKSDVFGYAIQMNYKISEVWESVSLPSVYLTADKFSLLPFCTPGRVSSLPASSVLFSSYPRPLISATLEHLAQSRCCPELTFSEFSLIITLPHWLSMPFSRRHGLPSEIQRSKESHKHMKKSPSQLVNSAF